MRFALLQKHGNAPVENCGTSMNVSRSGSERNIHRMTAQTGSLETWQASYNLITILHAANQGKQVNKQVEVPT